MKITDKRFDLLTYARTLVRSKNKILGSLEYVGSIDIGNDKKAKCQYIKGKLALPYEAIGDVKKDDISLVKMMFPPMILLPQEIMSSKAIEVNKKAAENFDITSSATSPKVIEALNNLIKALEEESL